MLKRIFDVVFSIIGLIILSPLLSIIAIIIKIDSKGPVFFLQERVGKDNKNFTIYKFRTMKHATSQNEGLLTLGNHDHRLTRIGVFLRRYKVDELPQLLNILIGTMSFVGPRPELRYFVDHYKKENYIVFSVRPGITSPSSINYMHEAELLKSAENPEEFYINNILPNKLCIDIDYIKNQNLLTDIKVILKTIYKVLIK